jgi:hypothetical protein
VSHRTREMARHHAVGMLCAAERDTRTHEPWAAFTVGQMKNWVWSYSVLAFAGKLTRILPLPDTKPRE